MLWLQLDLRLKHKKVVIEEKIHKKDEKVAKLKDLLPQFRREDLATEKEKERAVCITYLQTKQDCSSKKQFHNTKENWPHSLSKRTE